MPLADPRTPYGATEVLPATDVGLSDILEAGAGEGICVGRPVEGVTVAVAPLDEDGRAGTDLVTTPGSWGRSSSAASTSRTTTTSCGRRRPRPWTCAPPRPCWARCGRAAGTARGRGAPRRARAGVDRGSPRARRHHRRRGRHPRRGGAAGRDRPRDRAGRARRHRAPRGAPARRRRRTRRRGGAGREAHHGGRPGALAAVREATGRNLVAVLLVSALPTDVRHNSKIDRARVSSWAERVLAGERAGALA